MSAQLPPINGMQHITYEEPPTGQSPKSKESVWESALPSALWSSSDSPAPQMSQKVGLIQNGGGLSGSDSVSVEDSAVEGIKDAMAQMNLDEKTVTTSKVALSSAPLLPQQVAIEPSSYSPLSSPSLLKTPPGSGNEGVPEKAEDAAGVSSKSPPLKKVQATTFVRVPGNLSRHEKIERYEKLLKSEEAGASFWTKELRLDIDQSANMQLIDRILESNDIYNVQSGLVLANESIIKTADLFSLIHAQIIANRDFSNPHTEEKVSKLLAFCETWVEENKGTKYYKSARDIIQKIIEETSKSPFGHVRYHTEALICVCEAKEKTSTDIPPPAVQDGATDFEKDILERLANRERHSEFVGITAEDLLLAQVNVYCSTSPGDLIQKWDSSSEYGAALDRYTRLTEAITYFVRRSILVEQDFDKRVRVMRFFLDVAKSSLERGDYPSASAIYYAFQHGVFFNIVKKSVPTADQEDVLGQLASLFGIGPDPMLALQERMKESTSYIPYQSTYRRDLIGLNELKKILPDDYLHNIGKLSQIRARVVEYFKCKALWATTKFGQPMTTNVVSLLEKRFSEHTSPAARDALFQDLAGEYKNEEGFQEHELKALRETLMPQKKYSETQLKRKRAGLQKLKVLDESEIDKVIGRLAEEKKYNETELDALIQDLRGKK